MSLTKLVQDFFNADGLAIAEIQIEETPETTLSPTFCDRKQEPA